ncbi:MAG: tetratricopeptide repeat protein [Acidobacteria bacterium]|nr:tetratricopeptide repeat protein [Acidobacteriota bacterium]
MLKCEAQRMGREANALRGYAFVLLLCAMFSIPYSFASQPGPERSPVADVVTALRARNFDEALTQSAAALKTSPGDKRLWALRAMAYAGKGEDSLALGSYQHALKLDGAYLPALEGAAQIQFKQGSPEAKHLLLEILRQRPDDETSHAMLGFMEYREHDCEHAVADFQKGLQAVVRQPNALGAYGACLVVEGRYQDSLQIFERALALAPNMEELRLNYAVAQWKADRPQEALATLQSAIESTSATASTLLLAANIYESTNDTSHAVELIRRAILQSPKDVEAYLDFASLCYDHGSMQVGIDYLNAGLTQLPREGRLYLARGILYAQLGKFREATADFDTANRIDPNLSFPGVAQGLVESQEHKSGEALSSFRAAAKAHPNDALTQYLFAEALSEEGKSPGTPEYKEEVAAAERAARLDPKMVAAHDLLAKIYLQDGRNQLAIRESRAALSVDPQDQQALYHLILTLRKTDQKEEIPKLLEQLTKLRANTKSEAVQHRRYKLEEMPVTSSPTQ